MTTTKRETWQPPNHTMYPTMRLLGLIVSGAVIISGIAGGVWVVTAAGWLA